MPVILQEPSTYETRKVRVGCMLLGNVLQANSTLDGLPSFRFQLKRGALPVGSVEFVRAAMVLASIAEPANISYPAGCAGFLHRELHQRNAGEVIGHWFVKPVETKAFNGFVFDTMADPATLSEYDRAQHAAFMALAPNARVWVSEPVQWVSEWRYYVQAGQIIGHARYDAEGDEGAASPDLAHVLACIADLAIGHPYALDFGVLASGESALVEVNDAWAIGLYGDALSPAEYLTFLRSRWDHFLKAPRPAPTRPMRF